MISNLAIKKSLLQLGYRADDVHPAYRFAAVETATRDVRDVSMAAFLDGPASYKTAALAVVQTEGVGNTQEEVVARRSLGAPYLIVLGKEKASAWTYTLNGPSKIDESAIADWKSLIDNQQALFGANAVRQLKLLRVRNENQVWSLFDPATLRAIQADTQSAVFELLEEFLDQFQSNSDGELSLEDDYRTLFPMTFRLLAAKILVDREDARFSSVDVHDVKATLAAIEQLYGLSPLQVRWNAARQVQVSKAWTDLRAGLYVRNIAADDLAFVYEHTLITPEIREKYGTHSTPSCVADYVVRSFNLPDGDEAQKLVVYEPFAGSCVFLTAALRRFKELLPTDWSPKQIHAHLVKHFKASEVDSFACEIARLALILADYPNHNGWRIENEDLFAGDLLLERSKSASIVVCNPPFEDFVELPDGHSIHKPISALETILKAQPQYLGIVMPPGLSTHKKYGAVLDSLMKQYGDVEVLVLPEGAFRQAAVGAEVLIAQQPRTTSGIQPTTRLTHSHVQRTDWSKFEHTLRPSSQETHIIDPQRAPGLIGLRPLRDIWEELSSGKRLNSLVEIHRGLEWTYDQSQASRLNSAPGFRPGLHRYSDGGFTQFRVTHTVHLDCRREFLRGNAINHPWHLPKLICNSIRTSRGPWRLAASVDLSGLVASQQFLGMWLHTQGEAGHTDLQALCAIINSPIANAFSFCHDGAKGMRIATMGQIPLPRQPVAGSLYELVDEYQRVVGNTESGPLFENHTRSAATILMDIDAQVLAAYDLPPKLERALLRFMRDGDRPCSHVFPHYPGSEQSAAAIPLKTRLSTQKTDKFQAWSVLRTPLPPEVSDAFELA